MEPSCTGPATAKQLHNFSVFRPTCTDLGVPFKTIHAFQLCVWNSASEDRWKWNVYFKHTSVCMQELSPLPFLLFITFIRFPFFCFFFSNLFLCVIIPSSESQGGHSIHFLKHPSNFKICSTVFKINSILLHRSNVWIHHQWLPMAWPFCLLL